MMAYFHKVQSVPALSSPRLPLRLWVGPTFPPRSPQPTQCEDGKSEDLYDEKSISHNYLSNHYALHLINLSVVYMYSFMWKSNNCTARTESFPCQHRDFPPKCSFIVVYPVQDLLKCLTCPYIDIRWVIDNIKLKIC